MEAAHALDQLIAGADVQMVGVGEFHLAADGLQVLGRERALDSALGANIHKHRCLHQAMGSLKAAAPGVAFLFQ